MAECQQTLSLNKDKTKHMIHHFSQRDVSQLKITLNLEGKQIQGICEFNFLGTTIQETLNWAFVSPVFAEKPNFSPFYTKLRPV